MQWWPQFVEVSLYSGLLKSSPTMTLRLDIGLVLAKRRVVKMLNRGLKSTCSLGFPLCCLQTLSHHVKKHRLVCWMRDMWCSCFYCPRIQKYLEAELPNWLEADQRYISEPRGEWNQYSAEPDPACSPTGPSLIEWQFLYATNGVVIQQRLTDVYSLHWGSVI